MENSNKKVPQWDRRSPLLRDATIQMHNLTLFVIEFLILTGFSVCGCSLKLTPEVVGRGGEVSGSDNDDNVHSDLLKRCF